MYEVMKLEDELKRLRKIIRTGEATQEIINRVFEIQLLLDNVYYTEF